MALTHRISLLPSQCLTTETRRDRASPYTCRGKPKRKVQVKVWHYIPGILYKRYTTLYRERLALEVIRAIEELRSQDTIEKQSKAQGSGLALQHHISREGAG